MKTKKLINAKPVKRKNEHLSKLSIVKTQSNFTVYAVTNTGGFIPLRVGDLNQVIDEAEHCAAHLGLPVEHELNQLFELRIEVYKRVGNQWLWIGRELKKYADADEAYLNLRKWPYTIQSLELQSEAANVKRVCTCSHNCTRQWMTILHRLRFAGRLPNDRRPGECPRCFSHFVQPLEGGEFCLNCGHE